MLRALVKALDSGGFGSIIDGFLTCRREVSVSSSDRKVARRRRSIREHRVAMVRWKTRRALDCLVTGVESGEVSRCFSSPPHHTPHTTDQLHIDYNNVTDWKTP